MIEVRIPLERLRRVADNDVLLSVAVLAVLRAEKVPVRGAIAVTGVDSGTLSVTDDTLFDEQVWTWTP